MNILLVTHKFDIRSLKGTERHCWDLAQALRRAGHTVTLVAGMQNARAQNGTTSVSHIRGIDCYFIRTRWGTIDPRVMRKRIDEAFADVLSKIQADVVHIHHLAGLSLGIIEVCARQSIPTVFTAHDYWMLCPSFQGVRHSNEQRAYGSECRRCYADTLEQSLVSQTLVPRKLAPAVAWCVTLALSKSFFEKRSRAISHVLQQVDHVIAPSRFLAEKLSSAFPLQRTTVSLNGVECSQFTQTVSHPHPVLRCGFIGSLNALKGIQVVIDAFCQLRSQQVELRIFGPFNERNPYHRHIKHRAQCNPRIRFQGSLSFERIHEAYQAVDLVIVPSLWYENCPLVIQEAYASGRPVIASHYGALKEFILEDISGKTFPVGDADALAHIIRSVLKTPELLNRWKQHLPKVKSIDDQRAEFELLYSELLAKRAKRRERV